VISHETVLRLLPVAALLAAACSERPLPERRAGQPGLDPAPVAPGAPGTPGVPGLRPVAPLFVAVGPDGLILTSPDGTSWTPRSSGVDTALSAVAAGPSRFVAVGGAGTVVGSRDGVSWAPAASPTATHLSHVIFTGDHFVAVGGDWTSGAATITSADGESWVEMASPSNHMFHAVAYGGRNVIAAAYFKSDQQTPAQFHSMTGGVWTMRQGPDFYDSVTAAGLLVVVGGSVSVSRDDGASWQTTLPGWIGVSGVAFGGGTFVVVGELGLIYTSPDARAWAKRESPLGNAGSFYSVAYGGGRFVAVGSPRRVLTSADGATWTAGSSGVDEQLTAVTYGPPG
jgi:hypothetical protein